MSLPKYSLTTAVLLVFSLLAFVPAEATSLVLGDWQVDGANFIGILHITSVDASGNLVGTIYGDPIKGFYNSTTNHIVFVRQLSFGTSLNNIQVWEGALVGPNPLGAPSQQLLAGGFIAFADSGASAARYHFGWAAISP